MLALLFHSTDSSYAPHLVILILKIWYGQYKKPFLILIRFVFVFRDTVSLCSSSYPRTGGSADQVRFELKRCPYFCLPSAGTNGAPHNFFLFSLSAFSRLNSSPCQSSRVFACMITTKYNTAMNKRSLNISFLGKASLGCHTLNFRAGAPGCLESRQRPPNSEQMHHTPVQCQKPWAASA